MARKLEAVAFAAGVALWVGYLTYACFFRGDPGTVTADARTQVEARAP